jgi:excisionase family DNA binding protein
MARMGALRKATRVEPDGDQAGSAGDVVDAFASQSSQGVVLSFPDGRTVALPASLVDLVRASARELAEGHAIAVLPADAVLTPAEVGELLGLSRPFITRLLDDGEMPSERLPGSRHRRVRLADVLAFAERRDRRRDGRRQIAEIVTDEGLPY